MTDLPRFDRSVASSEIVQALSTVGCAIIERLVDTEVVDNVLQEMQPYIDATPYGSEDFTGLQTKRTGALLARSRSSIDLVAHPLVLDITQQILHPYASTFQLHLTQIIAIDPGGQAQGLHRDQWCFNMFPFPPEMDVEVSTIWALDDFTEENGATRVIPNSHHR
jgi:ectoine hydroxylase-related dioxygenase (phytanoyl-CoA dioxygenase family)